VKSAAELDGLPTDFIASHPPDANGRITLTTEAGAVKAAGRVAHP
jgi:hypothetical protein